MDCLPAHLAYAREPQASQEPWLPWLPTVISRWQFLLSLRLNQHHCWRAENTGSRLRISIQDHTCWWRCDSSQRFNTGAFPPGCLREHKGYWEIPRPWGWFLRHLLGSHIFLGPLGENEISTNDWEDNRQFPRVSRSCILLLRKRTYYLTKLYLWEDKSKIL